MVFHISPKNGTFVWRIYLKKNKYIYIGYIKWVHLSENIYFEKEKVHFSKNIYFEKENVHFSARVEIILWLR